MTNTNPKRRGRPIKVDQPGSYGLGSKNVTNRYLLKILATYEERLEAGERRDDILDDLEQKYKRSSRQIERYIAKALDLRDQEKQRERVVPRELIPKIEDLAHRIERITKVLKPNRELLSENRQSEQEIAKLAISGNTHPLLASMVTGFLYPWWCRSSSVQIRRYLSWKDDALLDYIIDLPVGQNLKDLLNKWEERANKYLSLKQSGANGRTIMQAYLEAKQTSQSLHSELGKIVLAPYKSN